jgi:hypothetical protein
MNTSMPGLIPLTVPRCLRTIRSPDRSSRALRQPRRCGTPRAHEGCTRATLHPVVPLHSRPTSAKGSSMGSQTGSVPSSTAYPANSRKQGTWRTRLRLRQAHRRSTTYWTHTCPTCPSTNSDAKSTPKNPSRCSAASSDACRRSNQSAPANANSQQVSAPARSSAQLAAHLNRAVIFCVLAPADTRNDGIVQRRREQQPR